MDLLSAHAFVFDVIKDKKVFIYVGVITPTMAIKRHKRGDRVYLSEYKQVREGKKVKSIFLRYLGPEDQIKAGEKPRRRVLDRLELSRSLRAGDVRLLWRIAEDLDFARIIDGICCQEFNISGPSPGKFLTIWAINRALDPESCTQLERWVPTTDLPMLAGISPELLTKDAFLSCLDFVCCHDRSSHTLVDRTAAIEDTLYQHWRHEHPLPPGDKETVAYDLTSVLFFGATCPLSDLGYNAKGVKRRQVNLALMASKWDGYPISHFLYNGRRNSSSTVKNLIARLMDAAIEPGTIIWDRGNVSREHVGMVEDAGWKLICGVPKTLKEVRDIITDTDVPTDPGTFVHKSRTGHLYAVKTRRRLFGKESAAVVCINQDGRMDRINAQNEALADIGEELDALSEKGKGWGEARLHKEIDAILGSWKKCVRTRVKRVGNGPRIEWGYKTREIANAEVSYGKYLLYSTDKSLSARMVVKTYLEKDFVEKVFRMLKTEEEVEPVRHRLEHRVRAYMFVCVLAYRLLSVLRIKMAEAVGKDKSWECTFDLLRELGRVERVEVGFGKEVRIWYLNVSKSVEKTLKKIEMKDLLKEETLLKEV